MNSPVEIPFKSFIEIVRESETPIFLQFANQLAKAIQLGFLPSGTKLPGTRQLSVLFSLHRNTIVAAFEELEAQGWIEIVPNKGSFVLFQKKDVVQSISNSVISLNQYPTQTGFTFQQSILLDNPNESTNLRLTLTDGTIDHRLAELKIPAKLYSAILKRKTSISKIKQFNNDYFLKNFANFLNISRGLHISKDNIIITRSAEIALFITTRILLNENDTIAVTNLSYYKSNMIFQTQNIHISQIKVDEFGIDTKHLRETCLQKNIRLLYITPHHHYPTTNSLSSERRVELLQLSKEFGFVIIEDDYDFDFHYNHHPQLPLASTDQNGMVLYTSKFGQYLAPGYRVGFLVAPENFITEAKKHLAILDQQVDPFIEQVLGEMINEGEITRILKKLRKVYHERRNYFCQLLNEHLTEWIKFKQPNGGLAIWIEFKTSINLMKLKKICANEELFIPQTILYQTNKVTAIRMGFAHLSFEEMDEIIKILKNTLTTITKKPL